MIPYRKTLWAGAFSLFLAGCGGSGGGNSGTPAAQAVLHGQVRGGQSPITGSTITLYTVGYGAAAASLATTTTDGNGNFDFGPTVTCASLGLDPAALVYVTASGGNPGAGQGVNNSAINLVAALGQCQSLTTANIDEVTTVAAAYALAGFTTATAGSINGVDVHASATNIQGIANAFATAAVLADPVSGDTPVAFGTSQAPAQQKLHSLANALAACVNTTDPSSAQCAELFACAAPGASFDGTSVCSGGSTAAVETMGAALSVTQNPGLVSVAGVYDTATRNVVFSPTLGTAPNDWTMGLSFPGFVYPVGIAIDAAGHVWVANAKGGSVAELDTTGVPVSGSPFTNSSTATPFGIAIDGSGDVWITNPGSGNNSVGRLDGNGAPIGSPITGGGLYDPFYVAVDAGGDVWVTNFSFSATQPGGTAGSISEITPTGAIAPGSPFNAGGKTVTLIGIDIDPSGHVWVADAKYGGVHELNTADGSLVLNRPVAGNGGAQGFPWAVAIDQSGDVWIGDISPGGGISELNPDGTPITNAPIVTGGISAPTGIAIDAGNHVWVADNGGSFVQESGISSIAELDSNGVPRSPSSGFGPSSTVHPLSIAVDASGNVWATNTKYNTVTELVGAATPTRTPLVSHITAGGGFAP